VEDRAGRGVHLVYETDPRFARKQARRGDRDARKEYEKQFTEALGGAMGDLAKASDAARPRRENGRRIVLLLIVLAVATAIAVGVCCCARCSARSPRPSRCSPTRLPR
jgi:hypothetical protein